MMGRPDNRSSSSSRARITNSWPRPGLSATSAEGVGLLGRFLSDAGCWEIETADSRAALKGIGEPLDALRVYLEELRAEFPDAGAVGYVGYEWGVRALGLCREIHDNDWRIPEIGFLIFSELKHPCPSAHRASQQSARSYSRRDLDALIESAGLHRSVSRNRYLADVGRIKEHIADGDIYQANYTQCVECETCLSADENALRLQATVAAPYSAVFHFDSWELDAGNCRAVRFPEFTIVCTSPERFWRKHGDVIDSRPIKGTIARGHSARDDRSRRRRLLASAKDRAELLMITDLVRNDLGQVAQIGTVKTHSLARSHPTPSVWHLESTITSRLAAGRTWVDVMKALSPAGSITGTPKRRAVEILGSLEPVARGPYCGAIGWIDARGDADFAVGIRTVVQSGDRVRVYGGGGIVADSDPEAEYYESLVKIAPLIEILLEQRKIEIHNTLPTAGDFHA